MDGGLMPGFVEVAPARGVRLRLALGFVAAMLVLLLLAIAVLHERASRAGTASQRLVEHADARTATVVALDRRLQDAETAQRLYALNPSAAPDAAAAAAAQAADALRALDGLSENAPDLQEPIRAAELAVGAELTALAQPDATAEATDQATALRGAARKAMADLEAAIVRLRNARMAALGRQVRSAETAIVSIAAAALLLLALAGALLLAGWNRLIATQAERDLETERLAATIEHLRDGIAVFDAADRLQLWNSGFFELTRLPLDLAESGAELSRFAEAAAGWPGAPLAAPRAPGAPASVNVAQDGRTLDVWRAAMAGGGLIVMVSDATKRVAAEATAVQSTKMAALEQLTGEVAHDFNNILQIVSSNLELLRPLLPTEDLPVRRLGAALSGVESAAQLTRHLLAFARRQPLMPDTVDPARLLHGLEDLLRQRLGERISVEVVVHSAVWALRADPQLLEDSILHLARNAREAMPRGGRLTLAASNVLIDEAAAAEQAEIKPGEYVLISVSDTGCGMASEVQARATEPFFTTKPDHPGSGLGLPIVLGFARQSEGNVTIESTLGRGTTVRLYLPRRRTLADPPPASPAPTPAQAPAAARGELVLAVEDDEAVRLAVVQALGSLGYQVMEASDAASALELMRNGARPDILFTDFVMPGEVGALDLAREARRLHPGIAVLLTSGYVDSANTLADAEDVPFALLSKPWRIGDLGRELRAALQAAGAAAANAAAPPAATPPALPATLPATPLATPAAERRPRRAMVVEDDAMVRMITAELLADLGYSVIEHSTGGAALQALNATGSDLLVTDVGLPDMSGLEMARRAVEITPSLAVVIASGDHHERDDGFTYLEKPYDAYRLRQAVTHARATGA